MISLIEKIKSNVKIIERDAAKLPSGVLCRAMYPICNINELNHNNRLYEKDLWDRVLVNEEIKEKLEHRNLFGQSEHPIEDESLRGNLEKTSHVIDSLYIDESSNKVKAVFDVLDTPHGRIINTLLEAGCDVGVSTRAEGDLEEKIDESGKKFHRVIPEAYKFITVDFTVDPSTFSPYPEKIERNLLHQVKTGLESKQLGSRYATVLLESMACKDAKCLLESISNEARGQGRGVGGKKQGDGGANKCKCPKCGYTTKHVKGTPCSTIKCPKCKKPMIGVNESKVQEGVFSSIVYSKYLDYIEDGLTSHQAAEKVAEEEAVDYDDLIDILKEKGVKDWVEEGKKSVGEKQEAVTKDDIELIVTLYKEAIAKYPNNPIKAMARFQNKLVHTAIDINKILPILNTLGNIAKMLATKDFKPVKEKQETIAKAFEPGSLKGFVLERVNAADDDIVASLNEIIYNILLEKGVIADNDVLEVADLSYDKDDDSADFDSPDKGKWTEYYGSGAASFKISDSKGGGAVSFTTWHTDNSDTIDISEIIINLDMKESKSKKIHMNFNRVNESKVVEVSKKDYVKINIQSEIVSEEGWKGSITVHKDSVKQVKDLIYKLGADVLKTKAVSSLSESKSVLDLFGKLIPEANLPSSGDGGQGSGSFDDMVKFMCDNFGSLPEEHQGKVRKVLFESISAPSSSKELRSIKESNAVVNAEKEKLVEALVDTEKKLAVTLSELDSVNEKLVIAVSNFEEPIDKGIIKLKAGLLEQKLTLKEGYTKELKGLKEIISLSFKKENKKLKKLGESVALGFKKEKEELIKKHEKQLLKKYFEARVNTLGLVIPSNALALLERRIEEFISSEQEIDSLVDEVREVIRQDLLHSDTVSEWNIPSKPLNESSVRIYKSISNLLQGMGC